MADVKTIGEALVASADRGADRVAYITDTARPSIGQVLAVSLGVRDLLRDRGARAGDRVVVWGDGAHPLEWMAAYFGVHLLGGWCVPLNPRLGAGDAEFFVSDLEPAAVLAPIELLPREVPGVWTRAGIPTERVIGLDLSSAAMPPALPNVEPYRGTDGGDLIYTTGTTGRPKGVILPNDVEYQTGARYAEAQTLTRGTVIHSPIPMFTASAIMTLILPIVAADATFSIDHPFEARRSLTRARDARADVFKAVPAHYLLIGDTADAEPVQSVRLAITTAAPLSTTGFQHMLRLFPRASIRALFGSTESAGTFTIIDEDQLRQSLGSLGSPAPGCAIRLLDPQPAGPGDEEGDLVLDGPFPATGYWRRSSETVAATFLAGGGVRTGDRAARADGAFVLRGRTSAVINRGGFKIDPAEIEAVVNRIAWVEESCVIAVAHDVLGEDLLLVLQVADGLGQPRLDELETELRTTLPKSKRPRRVIEGRLSRNALGKIDRTALRSLVEGQREQWLTILRGDG